MRQEFIIKNFTPASRIIIDTAVSICTEYAKQGFDLSLRQLYYQFVARDLLENTEGNYKKLGKIITDARLAGLVDWNFIKDRGREVISNPHWDNPGEILETCANQFRIDTWEDQPNYVMVMVEKQALEGVLIPTCKKLDVEFIANKGYSSASTMYEIGRKMHENNRFNTHARRLTGKARKPHIIYLGDHDPSGIDMTRDVFTRLSMFAETTVTVHRVALNMDQVEEYQPPENPTKLSDTRATKYIEEFGYSSWELDALEPAILAKLINDKILELRNDTLYEKQFEQQQTWRNELSELADNYLGDQ